MGNNITESKMMQVLDWSYNKAINGLPGMETAEKLGNRYLRKHNSVDEAIDELIKWQQAK
jgi:hypothetical protein